MSCMHPGRAPWKCATRPFTPVFRALAHHRRRGCGSLTAVAAQSGHAATDVEETGGGRMHYYHSSIKLFLVEKI